MQGFQNRESVVQQQVESSLTETNSSMNKLIAENRLLKVDMGLLNQRTEKLK